MELQITSECEDKFTITEQREELMIPPNSETNPTLRMAHFLKPLLNPKVQPLPKPPLHTSRPSNPSTNELEKNVIFKGRLKPQWSWKSWVEDLQKTHESIWKKAGIFNAIKGSTYKIKRDNKVIMCLAEKWCPETNTFVFPWGECSVTLEDIMILGGFSVMGSSVLLNPCFNGKKVAKIKDELQKSCTVIRRNCCNNLSHIGWLDYFMGKGGELEHVAFLVLWLSRFVLPTQTTIVFGKNNVLNIAISLAMGTKVALAPAVLASIYRDLTKLKEKEESSQLLLWAPFHLVQVWAWERFLTSSPKPVSLAHGEPRIARWHNVKKQRSDNLMLEIETADDTFVWRPYVMRLQNWDFPKFYCADDEGKWVVVDSEFDEELLSFVRCLRPCELVGLDCVMQYLPHRVGMQFGMDQDIPNFVPRFNEEYALACSSYAKPMEGLKVYLPPRWFEGDVTVQYSRWWRRRLVVDDDGSKTDSSNEEGCTNGFICAFFGGMSSEKLPHLIDDIASSASLNKQENSAAGKEKWEMVEYITPSTAYLEQFEDVVAEKEKGERVVDTASNTTLNEQSEMAAEEGKGMMTDYIASTTEQQAFVSKKERGKMVGEHSKGIVDQHIGPSTKACVKAAKANELGPEARKLRSIPTKDLNHPDGNVGAKEVKRIMNDSHAGVEEENDCAERFQQKFLKLESRMSRLEGIVSMYKAVKFGSIVDRR